MQNELLPDIFNTAIKSIVSITVLFLITKPIRKKHIAQLTFFDYIVGIAIGSIAGSFSVEKNAYYTTGLTALIIWGLFAFAVAYISMKSMKARHFLDGTPTILIQNGRILDENLKKEKVNINDLLEELRIKGVFSLAEVEFAILETNGEVSVQMKSQKRPLTPDDMHIPTRYQGLTANLIIDGNVMLDNLQLVNHDEKWLKDELSKRNIPSEKDILLAALDTDDRLYISMKGNKDTVQRKFLG